MRAHFTKGKLHSFDSDIRFSAARISVPAYALSTLAGVLKVIPRRQLAGASG
jgi:hypothetical protein